MKRFLIAALIFILAGLSVGADSIRAPKGFAGQAWKSTFALYGTSATKTQFLCTAEAYAKIPGGYRLLSAGHCVQTEPADLVFSVAEQIGGTRQPVVMVKASLEDKFDFAIFDLKTDKVYPVIPLGDDLNLQVGDKVFNTNFTWGLGEQSGSGRISSQTLIASDHCGQMCIGGFLVQLTGAGAGASGSAVVSARTHKIIGIVTGEWDEPLGFAVRPISYFAAFLASPTQPHPAETEPKATPTASVQIPANVFAAQFGEAHPFMLTAHGPNPTFVQAGYQFRVDIDGFELSDDYYYNVPVYIVHDAEGYWLTSTKDGFEVEVTVLGPAK
jgi:hypothetical protein